MKKLFISGSPGSGKTTAVHNMTEGKNTIILTPIEPVEEIIRKIQNKQYDYIVFEEANGFDRSFLQSLLADDNILKQSETSTIIIVMQSYSEVVIGSYNEHMITDEEFSKLKGVVYNPKPKEICVN